MDRSIRAASISSASVWEAEELHELHFVWRVSSIERVAYRFLYPFHFNLLLENGYLHVLLQASRKFPKQIGGLVTRARRIDVLSNISFRFLSTIKYIAILLSKTFFNSICAFTSTCFCGWRMWKGKCSEIGTCCTEESVVDVSTAYLVLKW